MHPSTYKHTHAIQQCVVEIVKPLSLAALFAAMYKLGPFVGTTSKLQIIQLLSGSCALN